MIVLSLKNLENAPEEEKRKPGGIYQWAKLFKTGSWEELKRIAMSDERMRSLVQTASQLTAAEEIRQMCKARERYQLERMTYEGQLRRAQEKAVVIGKSVLMTG